MPQLSLPAAILTSTIKSREKRAAPAEGVDLRVLVNIWELSELTCVYFEQAVGAQTEALIWLCCVATTLY